MPALTLMEGGSRLGQSKICGAYYWLGHGALRHIRCQYKATCSLICSRIPPRKEEQEFVFPPSHKPWPCMEYVAMQYGVLRNSPWGGRCDWTGSHQELGIFTQDGVISYHLGDIWCKLLQVQGLPPKYNSRQGGACAAANYIDPTVCTALLWVQHSWSSCTGTSMPMVRGGRGEGGREEGEGEGGGGRRGGGGGRRGGGGREKGRGGREKGRGGREKGRGGGGRRGGGGGGRRGGGEKGRGGSLAATPSIPCSQKYLAPKNTLGKQCIMGVLISGSTLQGKLASPRFIMGLGAILL